MTRKPKTRGKAKSRSRKVRTKAGMHAKIAARAKTSTRGRGATIPKAAARDPLDAMIAASAHTLGLPIDPAWIESIHFNLRLTLRHAALVAEFALPDEAEPAPVFHA